MTNRTKSIFQSAYTTTTGKTYKVTVTFIEVTEDEARIKRSIVESIMKKAINTNRPTSSDSGE